LSEYWLTTAIGAGIGVLMLALFARLSAEKLADSGFAALVAMVSVYLGARLVSGDMRDILIETAIASFWVIATRLAMLRWLPFIVPSWDVRCVCWLTYRRCRMVSAALCRLRFGSRRWLSRRPASEIPNRTVLTQ